MANNLTAVQKRVAAVLADAVAGHGFAMAGGSALNAMGLSDRLSEDIDAFSATCTDVSVAAARAAAAFRDEGWDVRVDRDAATFCRLVVSTGRRRRTEVVVELGQDAIEWGTQPTSVGPALTVRELAANKVLAAFGRIKPRDLCDLRVLADHVPVSQMVADAKAKDAGFEVAVLVEMIERTLARPDREWPPGVDVDQVRTWTWGLLRAITSPDGGSSSEGNRGPEGRVWVASYERRDGTTVGGYWRRLDPG